MWHMKQMRLPFIILKVFQIKCIQILREPKLVKPKIHYVASCKIKVQQPTLVQIGHAQTCKSLFALKKEHKFEEHDRTLRYYECRCNVNHVVNSTEFCKCIVWYI